jgi:putative colanic acid biosynthesis UDP-glucose lipid carrier transferase
MNKDANGNCITEAMGKGSAFTRRKVLMGSFQFGRDVQSLVSIPDPLTIRTRQSKVLALSRFVDSALIYLCMYFSLAFFDLSWSIEYLSVAVVGVILFGLCAELLHVYYHMRGLTTVQLVLFLVWAWVCTVGLMIPGSVILDVLQHVDVNALTFWALLTMPVVIAAHLLRRLMLTVILNQKERSTNVGIVGATTLGVRLYNTLANMPWLGCKLVGFYDDRMDMTDLTRRVSLESTSICGNLETLKQDVNAGKIDTVYMVLPMAAEKRVKRLIDNLADTTVTAYLIPDVFSFDLLHSRLTSIRGIPAVSIYDSPLEEHGFSKRLLDIVLSIVFISLAAVPMLIIAVAIKLTSCGPVLFKQSRYGFAGKEVKVWKFRSMTVCEDGDEVTQATKGDARITKVGAFIRRTSLDELPQFFNTLGGSMSIVGPRPHAVAHNEYYRRHIKGYMLRHKVKPGITGLAQINGFRGETAEMSDMAGRIHLDLEYIRNWSLWLDVKIVVLTICKGFIGQKAY